MDGDDEEDVDDGTNYLRKFDSEMRDNYITSHHHEMMQLNTAEVEAMLPRIRQKVSIPVGVGFGIRDAQTAQTISKVADAVVIGSKIIQLIENEPRDKVASVAGDFLRDIRQAMDA